MKQLIASVRNENNEITLIDGVYRTKKQFADDLRGNGFRVRFISTPKNFDSDAYKYNEKLENDRQRARIMREVRRQYA